MTPEEQWGMRVSEIPARKWSTSVPLVPLHNKFTTWAAYFCLALLSFYLLAFPTGASGYAIALGAFGASLLGATRSTLGVFFVLTGPVVVGLIFQSSGLPVFGSVVSLVCGFSLLLLSSSLRRIRTLRWGSPVLWLSFTVLLLMLFFLEGPRTEYSALKLLWFTTNLVVAVIAVGVMFSDPRADVWKLGLICIASAALYCAILFSLNPHIQPLSIWETWGMRNITSAEEAAAVATNTVALVASSGIVLMIGALVDVRPKGLLALASGLAILVGLVILNVIGQRLFMFAPLLALLAIKFCRPVDSRLIDGLLVVALCVLATFVIVGVQSGNELVVALFTSGADVDERVNRAVNWGAGMDRFLERPWFGHGLGGYFIPGYNSQGGEFYAHNLFLELLSETGAVGTVLILLAPISFLIRSGRCFVLARTANGASLTPFLVLAFVHAMISHDLRHSSMLFALVASLWARSGIDKT